MKQELVFQFSSLDDVADFEQVVQAYIPALHREGLKISGNFSEAEKELAEKVYGACLLDDYLCIEIFLN